MGLHRFKRGDIVHAKRDLKKKAGWGLTETVVLKDMRGIVKTNQTLFGTRVTVEFVNGRTLEVATDLLSVESKMFSLLP